MRPVAAALALLLAAGPAGAETGRTGAAFLQRALGAKAAGMGQAFAAAKRSVESVQYNPAGLATVDERILSSTYLNAFGSSQYGFLGYSQPLPYGTLGAHAVYFNAGTIDLNLSNGTTGTVTAEEDIAAALSYGFPVAFGLSLGATYRFVRMELADTASATTSQGDFGIHCATPLRGLSLGAAYQYVGPNITFEEAGDPPPRTFRYGLALNFPDVDIRKLDPGVDVQKFDFALHVDAVQTLYEEVSPRFGFEMGITPHFLNRVALRGGWLFGRAAEGMTIGIGYMGERFGFDYSLGNSPELGHLQNLTFTFYFDKAGA